MPVLPNPLQRLPFRLAASPGAWGSPRRRRTLVRRGTGKPTLVAAGCAVLVAAACSTAPPPAPDPGLGAIALRDGIYVGHLVIDDRRFDSTLRLTRATVPNWGGSLTVVSPVEIQGDVQAVAWDSIVRIRVSYTGADGCDGRIEGILDVGREGAVDKLDGPVTVHDCVSPVAGRMTFRRQPG
jgi:hypothetical protein